MSDDYTDVPYVGTVSTIEEKKNGWFSVHVAIPGKQYPVRADTKLEPLLKQAREVRDEGIVATFTVRESESENINPNTSKPYTERRLEKIEIGAQPPLQTGANANVSPSDGGGGMSKEEWARKDSAIHKMACIKTAAAALTHTMPADPTADDLNKFNERVIHLSQAFHRSVLAERDDPAGEAVPF